MALKPGCAKPGREIALLAVLALCWGFAEAVLFFLVADIVVTLAAARHGFRAGRIATLAATGGALWGGVIVYLWAAIDPAALERILDLVPAISAAQIAAVKAQVQEGWALAILTGGFVGNPYKLYAAAAGEQAVPLYGFVAVSFLARASRFFLAAVATHALATALRRFGLQRWIVPLWAVWWLGFYAWYLTATPW